MELGMSNGVECERRKKKKIVNLVFLPLPGMGHVVSMVELAKTILLNHDNNNHHRFKITILVVPPVQPSPQISAYVSTVEATDSGLGISFVHLPQMDPSNMPSTTDPGPVVSEIVDFNRPHVTSAMISLIRDSSPDSTVAALVADMYFVGFGDVALDVGVDFYIFFPASATMLGFALYLPTLDDALPAGKDMFELEEDESVDIRLPGLSSSIPAKALPNAFVKRNEGHVIWPKNNGLRYRDVKGIIVNSFVELQPHSVKALHEGRYISDHPTPPVYPVGPLLWISSNDNQQLQEQRQQHECIQWLNGKPPRSVVFLCFGSMGSFSKDQVAEIATGLERSGHRFLWVLRTRSAEFQKGFGQAPTEAVLNDVLPEGFLERTKERGMVWPSFAPQKEVLGHEAVGGFVTHCGWNSTIESLWYGVPMLAWPLYAEQHFNAFEMVVEMEVAVGLKVDRKAGNWVVADEIERGVRRLMEEEGKKVRSKVMEMSKMSKRTLVEGGSSFLFMERLLEEIASDKI